LLAPIASIIAVRQQWAEAEVWGSVEVRGHCAQYAGSTKQNEWKQKQLQVVPKQRCLLLGRERPNGFGKTVDVHKGGLGAIVCATKSEHWETVFKGAVSTLLMGPNCSLRIQNDRAVMRAEMESGDVAATNAATSSLLGSGPIETMVKISDVDEVLAVDEAGKAFRDSSKTVKAL
jgi:hypothetical protein